MSNIDSGDNDPANIPVTDDNQPLRNEAAVELVRSRIKELYKTHHKDNKTTVHTSLLEKFKQNHQDHPDKQAAWELFYNNLSADEKQQLWDEYHDISSTQEHAAQHQGGDKKGEYGIFSVPKPLKDKSPGVIHPSPPKEHAVSENKIDNKSQSIADVKSKLLNKVRQPTHYSSFWSRNGKAFIMAGLVMFILLFANYNQLFVAQIKQFISPGDSLNSPIIVDPNAEVNIGKESRIIIPKINVDVPVVYDINTYDENTIQAGLERGVVHYYNTSLPGKPGNNVIVGHSSNNFFNAGKYKFAFVLIDRLELGDTFILHYKSTRYVYKVTNKKVVSPDDFSLIQPTAAPTTTLITCTPPGTSWNRLIVQGEQISPSPTKSKPSSEVIEPTDTNAVVPGNSPSLLSKIIDFFKSLLGN